MLVFFGALAIDFRAQEGGGSAVQYLVFVIALGAGLWGARSLFRGDFWTWHLPPQIWLVIGLITCELITWPFRDNPIQAFLGLLGPYLLFMVGGLLGQMTVERSPVTQSGALTAILVTNLLGAAWFFFYGLTVLNLNFSDGRYYLVSPAIPVLLGLALVVAVFPLPQRWLAAFTIVVCLLLILISITRGFLISSVGLFAYVSVVLMVRGLNAQTLRAATAMIMVVIVGVAGSTLVFPDFVQRWTERLTAESVESGEQRTAITREAEWINQVQQLTESPASLAFGKGLGARYYWDEAAMSRIPGGADGRTTADEVADGVVAFGHSYWVFSAFAGGFLSGWIMPLILVMSLYIGLDALWRLRRLRRRGMDRDPNVMWDFALGAAYLAVVVGVFLISFTSNPMGHRILAALFGFSVAASAGHLRLARRRSGL